MHYKRSTLSQVQTSHPEILDSKMIQIDNSTQAIRERDKQQRPVTQTYTSSQDPIALAYPVQHGTTPSSKKKAEKHTSAPCPPYKATAEDPRGCESPESKSPMIYQVKRARKQ
jgi:hypothetical protein